jgi:hypothetical protein
MMPTLSRYEKNFRILPLTLYSDECHVKHFSKIQQQEMTVAPDR